MAVEAGQKKKATMNGQLQRYINQGLAVAILIFVGIYWIDPVVQAYRATVDTQAKQMPEQTHLLETMVDQGKTTQAWQEGVMGEFELRRKEHAEHSDQHENMCDVLKTLKSESG